MKDRVGAFWDHNMDWKEKAEEGIIIFDSKTGYLYPEPDNQAPSMQANNRRWDNLNNISTCLFDVYVATRYVI